MIGKKTRQEAVDICEMLGNDRISGKPQIGGVDEMTDNAKARDLASMAFSVIPEKGNDHLGFEWLEAAALLRDGWEPGDVPVLLVTSAPDPNDGIDFEDDSDEEPEPDYGYDDSIPSEDDGDAEFGGEAG